MPIYTQLYNNWDYDPAMPVAEITLHSPLRAELKVSMMALIDSGSDATMLPAAILKSIGARHYRGRQVRGITGQALTVDTYLISIGLGPYTIHGIEAVAMSQNKEAILGRDVLNQLELTLNGPAQETWIA
ncbi:aspartyl protease family protein [Candidatus Promineifilum breve]|nr:aspartyl protease family protein [Candidatus Promineifilum breve]